MFIMCIIVTVVYVAQPLASPFFCVFDDVCVKSVLLQYTQCARIDQRALNSKGTIVFYSSSSFRGEFKPHTKKAAHTVCYSPFRGHSLKDADYYIHKRPHIACCVNQAIDLRSVFVCMVLISSFYFILIFSVLLLTCSCPTVDYFLAIYSRTTIPCNFNMFNVLCFFFLFGRFVFVILDCCSIRIIHFCIISLHDYT